jgi:DNA repair exonuclease SbcCD nuclease subunit
MKTTNRKPLAVLTADVHYNQNTLAVADAAMNQAIDKANELGVPFIVAGDLHDTKAIIRGECIKTMIRTFERAAVPVYVIVGNHCKINEKGDDHSLEFLRPYITRIIETPVYVDEIEATLLPYYSDSATLQAVLSELPSGSRLIMHQGLMGAAMGHYVVDKTSLPPEAFADFRVISGHYHKAQDIKCGRPRKGAVGLFSYIGNPYSLSFGEAHDGPKGFQILYSDGLMEQVPTNLRSHIVVDCNVQELQYKFGFSPEDLIWLKVRGPRSELAKLNKKEIGQGLLGHNNFKLDLIPTDSNKIDDKADGLQDTEILDVLIGAMPDAEDHKTYLKKLWREIL